MDKKTLWVEKEYIEIFGEIKTPTKEESESTQKSIESMSKSLGEVVF